MMTITENKRKSPPPSIKGAAPPPPLRHSEADAMPGAATPRAVSTTERRDRWSVLQAVAPPPKFDIALPGDKKITCHTTPLPDAPYWRYKIFVPDSTTEVLLEFISCPDADDVLYAISLRAGKKRSEQ